MWNKSKILYYFARKCCFITINGTRHNKQSVPAINEICTQSNQWWFDNNLLLFSSQVVTVHRVLTPIEDLPVKRHLPAAHRTLCNTFCTPRIRAITFLSSRNDTLRPALVTNVLWATALNICICFETSAEFNWYAAVPAKLSVANTTACRIRILTLMSSREPEFRCETVKHCE